MVNMVPSATRSWPSIDPVVGTIVGIRVGAIVGVQLVLGLAVGTTVLAIFTTKLKTGSGFRIEGAYATRLYKAVLPNLRIFFAYSLHEHRTSNILIFRSIFP